MLEYNEERGHDSLVGMTLIEIHENSDPSTFELSTLDGEAYAVTIVFE